MLKSIVKPVQRFSDVQTFFLHAALLVICSLFLLSDSVARENLGAGEHYTITVFEDHNNFLKDSQVYATSWKILSAAIKQQQLPVDVISVNWNSSMNRLKKGKVDLIFGAFKTPERAQWASFSLPLLPEESVLFALEMHPVNSLSDITDFTQYSVATIKQSTQLGLAEKMGFETIYAAGEREKLRDLLFSKRVDFVMAQGSFPIDCRNGICVKRYAPLAQEFYRVMGVSTPETIHLLQSINEGLRAVVNSPETLKFLGEYPQPPAITDWRTVFNEESQSLAQ